MLTERNKDQKTGFNKDNANPEKCVASEKDSYAPC